MVEMSHRALYVLGGLVALGIVTVAVLSLSSEDDKQEEEQTQSERVEELDDEPTEEPLKPETPEPSGAAAPADHPAGPSSASSSPPPPPPAEAPPVKENPTAGAPAADENAAAAADEAGDEQKLQDEFYKCSSVGTKYFKGQKYKQAHELFSRAIEIGEQLNLEQGKLETLYNNRSAVLEKLGRPMESLADCITVLAMNPAHSKVRKRRARIYMAQENPKDALVELCAVLLAERETARKQLEQYKDSPPQVQQMMMQKLAPQPPAELDTVMQACGKTEVARIMKERETKPIPKPTPSDCTVNQLLLTYSEFLNREADDKLQGRMTKELIADVRNAEASGDIAAKLAALNDLAFRYMATRKFAEAKEQWRKVESILKTSDADGAPSAVEKSRLLRWVGFFYHVNFDLDTALGFYEQAEALFPTADGLLMKAGIIVDKGDPDTAMELINQAGERDPRNVDYLVHRSQLWILKKELDKVQEDLKSAIELRPDHALAMLRLATVLLHTNQIQDALPLVEKAESVRPRLCEVFQVKGELALAAGNVAEAMTNLDKAIELDPTNPTPYMDKGMTIWQTTLNKDEALAEFQKAITADPTCASAHARIAEIKLQFIVSFGDAEQVVADLGDAIGQCRETEEMQELCMVRSVAQAQLEAAKDLGFSSFAPGINS